MRRPTPPVLKARISDRRVTFVHGFAHALSARSEVFACRVCSAPDVSPVMLCSQRPATPPDTKSGNCGAPHDSVVGHWPHG